MIRVDPRLMGDSLAIVTISIGGYLRLGDREPFCSPVRISINIEHSGVEPITDQEIDAAVAAVRDILSDSQKTFYRRSP